MAFGLAVLAAFAAVLCWGIGDFMIQRNVRKVGDNEALLFIGAIGGVMLLPFAWNDIPALLEMQNLLLIGALGIMTFAAAMLDFEALKQGKLSVIEVILEIELPITIILGLVFFHESLSVETLAAIGFIFLGIVLMAVKSHHIKNIPRLLERGVIWGVLGAICMGAVNFLTAASARQISPIMAVWGPYVIFSMMCLVLLWKSNGFGKIAVDWKKFRGPIIAMGIVDTLAWVFYAIATANGEIAAITAITECYPAIGLFLGIQINKEHVELHQILGGAIALVAGIALAFAL